MKQKYNDAIAVNHIKIWVDQGKNVYILNWLETLIDEMESPLYHYNSSTIPPQDPPYEVHQLIQNYSRSPSFTSSLATNLQNTYKEIQVEKLRCESNRRKALL